jgi:hypothetical protein
MIRAEDKVAVALTVNEWNTVLNILGEQPFKVAASMIGQITGQVQTAITSSERPPHVNGTAEQEGGRDGEQSRK